MEQAIRLELCELGPDAHGLESISPFCLKVHRALKFHGLSYRRRHAMRPSEHKHLSRTGQVPVLIIDGKPVGDSTAIIEALEDLSSKSLVPADLQQRTEAGLMVVAPDTSPRGDDVPDDDAYDLGQGAGFYLDATESPWAANFQMYSYITRELPKLVLNEFPANAELQGIAGHSMGGHGALTIGLKHPERYRSISAFAPIVAPMQCPWGEKAFAAYLGSDRETWRQYDATDLVASR